MLVHRSCGGNVSKYRFVFFINVKLILNDYFFGIFGTFANYIYALCLLIKVDDGPSNHTLAMYSSD